MVLTLTETVLRTIKRLQKHLLARLLLWAEHYLLALKVARVFF